ncbi:hypothetical protein ACIBCH_15930 [Amycolatopsis thailandensis]|uniref:hypothetical protein n=1 Tax=Amycolatopsis thailandensis TaxID=589330 RepID=UPI0037B0ECF5
MRQQLRGRMASLAVGELVSVVVFFVVFFALAGVPLTVANVSGYLLTTVMLLQGSAYWMGKRRELEGHRGAFTFVVRVLRVLAPVNVALIAIGVVPIVVEAQAGSLGRFWLGAALWALAVAEYVNYFHVQLAYGRRADRAWILRNRRLRRSHLARDISRLRSAEKLGHSALSR